MLRFRFLGASFSRFGCSVFEFWVLRFRDLGASFSSFGCFVLQSSFSRFGCFVLRSLFSSTSFSKLPLLSLQCPLNFQGMRTFGDTVGTVCVLLDFDALKMENIVKMNSKIEKAQIK